MLRVVPESTASADTPVDWTPLVLEAGVDPSSLTAETPDGPVPPFGDQRFAWRGRTTTTAAEVQIEAASLGNRPTWFEVGRVEAEEQAQRGEPGRLSGIASTILVTCVVIAGVVLAKRNLREGRADVRSAGRLAAFLFLVQIVGWLLSVSLVPFEIELVRTMVIGSLLLVLSFLEASLYLVFEPLVRRRWPTSLISWSRLLSGRFRDARVGRDVLIGATAAVAGTALYQVLTAAIPQLRGDRSAVLDVSAFMGMRHLIATLLSVMTDALASSMVVVLIYSLLVMVLRRAWAATMVMLIVTIVPAVVQTHASPLELVVLAIGLALYVRVFVEFGLVSLMAYTLFDGIFSRLPLSFASDWRSEFAIGTLIAALSLLGFAAYTSLRGRMRVAPAVAR